MRVVVVYESMYRNTHLIADAIGRGLRGAGADVAVVPVDDVNDDSLDGTDLIVVGGPTHAHGMSRAGTRDAAVADARKPDRQLMLDADAEGEGLREWFECLGQMSTRGAAFDTRFDLPAAFTGRASKGIARRLRHHGCTMIAEPKSFFVTKHNELEPDETARAQDWGARLGTTLADLVVKSETR